MCARVRRLCAMHNCARSRCRIVVYCTVLCRVSVVAIGSALYVRAAVRDARACSCARRTCGVRASCTCCPATAMSASTPRYDRKARAEHWVRQPLPTAHGDTVAHRRRGAGGATLSVAGASQRRLPCAGSMRMPVKSRHGNFGHPRRFLGSPCELSEHPGLLDRCHSRADNDRMTPGCTANRAAPMECAFAWILCKSLVISEQSGTIPLTSVAMRRWSQAPACQE